MGSQRLPERITDLQAYPSSKAVRKLRFLGMFNFYRRFLLHAATLQAPLHDGLSGPKVKGSHPVIWSDALVAALNDFNANLSRAALLSHPHPTAPPTLVKDVSTTAMSAVLQQRGQDV